MAFNLIQPLEMALTPIVERAPSGPVLVNVSSGDLKVEHGVGIRFTVPNLHVPIDDVQLSFTSRSRYYGWFSRMVIYLNEEYGFWPYPDPYVVLWQDTRQADCLQVQAEVTVPLAIWQALAGPNGEMFIYMLPAVGEGSLCPFDPTRLYDEWIRVDVSYEYAAPPAGEDPEPYFGWATHHDTLAGEPRGEMKRLMGEWRIDPQSAELVCYVESGGLYALGGMDSVEIPGEPGSSAGEPGVGSVTVGELTGTLLRLQTRSACIPV